MKQLFLFFAVLSPFAPDVGTLAGLGGLGDLSSADKLLGPASAIVWLVAGRLPPTPLERYARPLFAFVLIGMISSLSVPLRFPSADPNVVVMGVLRMAKFSGYVFLAVGSLRCFATPRYRETVLLGWGTGVALVSGVLVYRALVLDAGTRLAGGIVLLRGNPTSVALACVVVSGLAVQFSDILSERRTWRLAAVTLTGVIGMIFSQGRGGWLALLVGGAFLIRKISARSVFAVITIAIAVGIAAVNSPSVNRNLRGLIVAERGFASESDETESSLTDSGRIETWFHEGAKLAEQPLLGFGVFHRGGASPLWSTGSHNFFLQMFLETGVLGGGALLWLLWSLWRATNTLQRSARTGVRAVLVTILSGGMGGEYFYGDAPLYCCIIGLWMLAIPSELGIPSESPAERAVGKRQRPVQPRRLESTNSERSGIPALASASEPPSPRSTTQSAPST